MLAGVDGSGGLLVPGYAELPLLGAAPAAPAAGKARAYLDASGGLQLLPAAGILGRRVAVHWGTVTAFPALAAAGDTCVRTDVGTAGSLWQYTGIASSGAAGWVTESPIVCTSTTRPTGAVLYDGLPIYQTDDKATAYWDVANTVWHIWDSVTQSYNVSWTSQAGTPAIGNGQLAGRYRRMGRLCWVDIVWSLGATGSNGGTGSYTFTLPAAALSGIEQFLTCKAFMPGTGSALGYGYITSGGANSVVPYMPVNLANNNAMNPAQSANTAGTSGTGVPAVAGFTYSPGANMAISGAYEMNLG